MLEELRRYNNQLLSQLGNKLDEQVGTQPSFQSNKQPDERTAEQAMGQPIEQAIGQATGQAIKQTTGQPMVQPIGQPGEQPGGQGECQGECQGERQAEFQAEFQDQGEFQERAWAVAQLIGQLTDAELIYLLETNEFDQLLFWAADQVRQNVYGRAVYIRGLIEISNYCRNNCYYCGIRKDNRDVQRYRLSEEQILDCCARGYELGFRTFVLQGGEDPYYNDEKICQLVAAIKRNHPHCALTLSLGERGRKAYEAFFKAGANRYLLRHESADAAHYAQLHPHSLSLENRKQCLWNLKEIGYQVGSGFMVGSPHQNSAHLLKDIRFLQTLNPEMIGVGPFIPHPNTPFKQYASGNLNLCLRVIAILRLLFPHALIPATTALGTIAESGRKQGLLAGANVVMPNLSPAGVRKLYSLYANKIYSGEEAAESLDLLKKQVQGAGYCIVVDRGDAKRPKT